MNHVLNTPQKDEKNIQDKHYKSGNIMTLIAKTPDIVQEFNKKSQY